MFAEHEVASLTLVDINPRSVEMSRLNAETNFPGDKRIQIFQSDIFKGVPQSVTWDMIIGNPPHNLDPTGVRVRLTEMEYVQAHDPNLDFHRQFFAEARTRLPIGGKISFLENGDKDCITADHIAQLLKEFPAYNLTHWEFLPGSQFYVIDIERVA